MWKHGETSDTPHAPQAEEKNKKYAFAAFQGKISAL